MKKSFKKYLSIYLSIFIILLNCVPIVSHAAGEFSLQTGKGWVYSEENDLPTGHNVYFQFATGKAWYTSDVNLALQLANRQGLIINPTSVNGVFSTLWDYLVTNADAGGYYKVYKGETVVGIAVNDLSGCTLNNHTGVGGTFDVPSGLNNTVHNYLDEQTADELPDYVNIPTFTENLARNYLILGQSDYSFVDTNLSSPPSKYLFKAAYRKSNSTSYSEYFSFFCAGITKGFDYNEDVEFIYSASVGDFMSLCSFFGLSSSKNALTFPEMLTSSNYSFPYYIGGSNGKITSFTRVLADGTSSTQSSTDSINLSRDVYGSVYESGTLIFSNQGWITLYKNLTTISNITNNTYAPTYRVTKNFMDYDSTSTTNVTTVNTNNIDNSQQNNETIYNNSNTEINQNMSENNYTYNTDNSSTIINNIVNNYYSDSSGGDDEGGDDSGDGILDTLLDALLGFFRAIGKIIATILTGVVEILTSVLEAIGNITEDFTGITDFLSSFFSFLPEPIISVLVLGVTISVLWAMICMFKK